MGIVDSHAHLTSDEVFQDIENVLERASSAGIQKIINICTDDKTLERGLALRKKFPWVYNTASTTPHDVLADGDRLFPLMEKAAMEGNLVAVGETGLDYYYHEETKELQQHFLQKYLKLALETNLPVVIHCRDAFEDFFNILDEHYVVDNKHAPGVLHCFTGSVVDARDVVERGWYLSLSGIVTFKKSQVLREAARATPLNQLLIETDAPYLAPQSRRGRQNEPAYITETAELLAELKQISVEELIEATAYNAKNLFRI